MLDDRFNRVEADKKPAPSPTGPTPRHRPTRRGVLLVAVTASLSWMLARLHYSPSARDVARLEAYRTRPYLHVEIAESHGAEPGEMDLKIDLANIGHRAYDISLTIRPLEAWASFGNQTAVKITPAMPLTARIVAGQAMIKLLAPVQSGAVATVTISGIKVAPHPDFKHGIHNAFKLDIHSGKWTEGPMFYRTSPPNPTAATPKVSCDAPGGISGIG